jgi:hypothetical protein
LSPYFVGVSWWENADHFPRLLTQTLLAQTVGIAVPAQVPSAVALYVSTTASELIIASFQSLNANDFTSQGMLAISLTVSSLLATPLSPIITPLGESKALNGFGSLFFHASHNFVSLADNCLRSCALLTFGLGFGEGEGDALGWGCAKHKEANAMTSIAARGRCLFILGSPRIEFVLS